LKSEVEYLRTSRMLWKQRKYYSKDLKYRN